MRITIIFLIWVCTGIGQARKQTDNLASEIIRDTNQRYVKISVDNTGTFLYQHVNHLLTSATSVEDLRRNLVFLVVCRDCFHNVITLASQVDNATGQQSLRHFSTWLFLTQYPVTETETTFDNVAGIRLQDVEASTTEGIVGVSVLTLLWMPDGRRWVELFADKNHDTLYLQVFPNLQRGLNGRCLLIGSLQWIPQTIRTVVNGTVLYTGASIDYIRYLSLVFNFTYKIVEPVDGEWGGITENGSWTGVIRMLQNQEIDLAGCPYAISASRADVVDFGPPVYSTEFVVIYARTRSSLYFWKFLFLGLRWEVYLCFAVAFLCSCMLYTCILYLSGRHCEGNPRQSKLDALFLFAVVFVRQDIHSDLLLRLCWSGRILVFFWAAFCFMFTAIYSGTLVASATVEKLDVPFTTLQELADQQEYTVSSYDSLLPFEIMQGSKHLIYKQLYDKAKAHKIKTTSQYLQYGLRLILEHRHALIASTRSFQAMRANSCDIQIMRQRLFLTLSAFTFPRHSPLVKLFHDRWMWDSGLAQEKQREWQPDPKRCQKQSGVMSNQFKLGQLKSLFVVCASGVAFGAVVLVIESWNNLCEAFQWILV